ncbi:MAG TPA: hypothetical protein DEA08_04305 [Planctomycetes bacterium]|nr:hypothetical protein [Planctomycetota bacterium]
MVQASSAWEASSALSAVPTTQASEGAAEAPLPHRGVHAPRQRRKRTALGANELPVLGATLDGYRLEPVLAYGSYGAVLSAERVRDGRPVALKVLRGRHRQEPRMRSRLLLEATLLLELDHPRLVSCLDAGVCAGWPYLVMPKLAGRTLRQHLGSRVPLTRQLALSCGEQLLEALAYLHERDVVHRDVKPGNAMLDAEGRCTLLDLGLALAPHLELGTEHDRAGTRGYRAPELEGRASRADGRADLYGLAVTLHELLTGIRPLETERGPTPSAWLPSPLRAFLARCLRPDPDHRYASARDCLAALRACAGSLS